MLLKTLNTPLLRHASALGRSKFPIHVRFLASVEANTAPKSPAVHRRPTPISTERATLTIKASERGLELPACR